MSDTKYALVLQLAAVAEPMLIAVDDAAAERLGGQLESKLLAGNVETVTATNGIPVVVNFAHVVAAHIDTAPPLGRIYGSPTRRRDE